jgi:hypothetical protein
MKPYLWPVFFAFLSWLSLSTISNSKDMAKVESIESDIKEIKITQREIYSILIGIVKQY